MNGLSVDSTKLLTEKLALSRELAILKPELEHLRSQASYQQTVLSEKLALQRQVSTLEVELETEKRASKRAGQKDKDNGDEHALQKQLDELRNELAKERRDKEKAQEASERNLSGWETQKVNLEGKVEQLRTKLRETKSQVKELQKDVAKAQAAATKVSTSSLAQDAPIINPQKRTAAQISAEAQIGTPDGVAVRGKRPTGGRTKPEQIALREKSMFSITPLLNRTISIAPS
jgi:chromosome segregation ATPase